MTFKQGDIVRLKLGGPRMIVNSVSEGFVSCYWFDLLQVSHYVAFRFEILEACE